MNIFVLLWLVGIPIYLIVEIVLSRRSLKNSGTQFPQDSDNLSFVGLVIALLAIIWPAVLFSLILKGLVYSIGKLATKQKRSWKD